MGQIDFNNGGSVHMTTVKEYDYLNRLTSISSVTTNGTALPITFNYSYNDANQRTRRDDVDGSYWVYQYDSLGQVTSGKKYWADGTPVAGQQFEYTFDDIGNRKNTKSGGDENGANPRSASYTANNLNQYTSRGVPGYVDIMGLALATNTVTVNGTTAYRKGEYFRNERSVSNNLTAIWTNIIVAASGETSVTGNVFVAGSPEAFGYDLDGNLTNDGRWAFTWDAENRLTQIESLTNGPTASKRRVTWQYDGKGRRQRQTTYDLSSGSAVVTEDLKFVNDGWRCLAELNATNNALVRRYTWGSDLSGSMDGAGGVGGLLWLKAGPAPQFCAYDGNGNVAGLVRGSTGDQTAAYEYDPFGRTIRMTGVFAKSNPFRFSTKRANDTSDLVLYEYRAYNPSTGRWLSRDSIEEDGSFNLYAFVSNSSVDLYDFLGMLTASARYVGKSFIHGVGPLGTLGSPAADARLATLAKYVGQFAHAPFNQFPGTDAKDGEYRLYGMVEITAECCDNSLTSLEYTTDMEGGSEFPLIKGTIDMSVSSSIGTSSGNVNWITFGRPNALVEPGMQWVQTRTSFYIWHYVKVRIDCVSGIPTFSVESFRGSRYPSRRLWRDGIRIGNFSQGTFSDLWRAQPGFPDFVAE